MNPVKVLVVDDSSFFRRRIVQMLEADPQLEVLDTAANGKEAVEKAAQLKPDVITMDIEMPVMDGITAVKRIMAADPLPVLMFSSLTHEGAKATLDALEAGAMDFLPKKFDEISNNREEVQRMLCRRVHSLGRRGRRRQATASATVAAAGAPRASAPPAPVARGGALPRDLKIVAIGASTGGPVALQQVLSALPANFPLPLVLIQHMPATFTPAFAERLNQQCAIAIRQAEDGDALEPGVALLAPGGQQMIVESSGTRARVRITESTPGQHYRPCVDVTFASVAEAFPGKALAVVLTGMGADGREGARKLSQGGAAIWTQDEATSVIYGMPAAVAEAGLSDRILPIAKIGPAIAERK